MIQQTSLDAYEQLKDNNRMGKMQQLVYDTIKRQPYSTDKDIAQILIKPINQITPRRLEILNKGLIQKAGITYQDGRMAMCWCII